VFPLEVRSSDADDDELDAEDCTDETTESVASKNIHHHHHHHHQQQQQTQLLSTSTAEPSRHAPLQLSAVCMTSPDIASSDHAYFRFADVDPLPVAAAVSEHAQDGERTCRSAEEEAACASVSDRRVKRCSDGRQQTAVEISAIITGDDDRQAMSTQTYCNDDNAASSSSSSSSSSALQSHTVGDFTF